MARLAGQGIVCEDDRRVLEALLEYRLGLSGAVVRTHEDRVGKVGARPAQVRPRVDIFGMLLEISVPCGDRLSP